MIFTKTGNVSIFPVIPTQTRNASVAFFAIARCMRWEIDAEGISVIMPRESRIVPFACAPIAGKNIRKSLQSSMG